MKKVKQLVLIGSGEFASIAYEYFTHDSEYEVVAFSVDREYVDQPEMYSIPIVPFDEIQERYPPSECEAFVAIPVTNLNRIRSRFFQKLKSMDYKLATYISSHAFVWHNAKIGENCFIFENNTVQPFTTIEDNVILWSGNHIGHRTIIRKNAFVSSHVVISGYCEVGEYCFLGVNSTFNDETSIPRNCILASASLVNRRLIEEDKIYMGQPAKPIPGRSALSVKL